MLYIHTRHNFSANFAHFLRMRRRMRKKCAKMLFLSFFYLRNFNACVNAYVEFAQKIFLAQLRQMREYLRRFATLRFKKSLFCALYKGSLAAGSASVAAFLPFAKGASASLSPSKLSRSVGEEGRGDRKTPGFLLRGRRKASCAILRKPRSLSQTAEGGRRREAPALLLFFPSQRFLDGKSAVWQAVERRHGHNTQTNSGGGGRRREGPGNLYASFFSVRGGHREEPPKWLLLPFPSPLLIATSLGIMGAKEEDRGGDKSFFC